MEQLLASLLGLGCSPVDTGRRRAGAGGARPLRAGGFLFDHQSPHPGPSRGRLDRSGEPAHGRDDRGRRTAAPPAAACAICKTGDRVVVGMRGIRVVPESKERDRLAFAFMSNGISSERQVETAVRQTAALMRADASRRAENRRGRRTGGGAHRRRAGALGADPRRLGAGAAGRQCAGRARYRSGAARAPRSACARATGGRRSTAIAITCAPSTRSITPAASPRRSKPDG